MATGDAATTCCGSCSRVGLEGKVCPAGPLPKDVRPEDFARFCRIFPEGKYELVKSFQKSGHHRRDVRRRRQRRTSAPSSQMGVAVSTATDVASQPPGSFTTSGSVASSQAVKEGRLLPAHPTYTLNSFTKKIANVLFLTLDWSTRARDPDPMLMVIIMITATSSEWR